MEKYSSSVDQPMPFWLSTTMLTPSRKYAKAYRRAGHWTTRMDVWPFLFVFYPSLLAYWIQCINFKVPFPDVLIRVHDEVPFSDQLFFYLAVFLLVVCHLLCHFGTYWSLRWKLFVQFSRIQSSTIKPTDLLVEPTTPNAVATLCPIQSAPKAFQGHFCGMIELSKKWYLFDQDYRLYPMYYPSNAQLSVYQTIAKSTGFMDQCVNQLMDIYGLNSLDIPIPTFMTLFKEHIVAPFFAFQVFCVLLWLLDDYRANSLITLALLIFLESQIVFKRIHELGRLRDMRLPPLQVYVWRKGKWTKMSSDFILPGDIMAVPDHSSSATTKKPSTTAEALHLTKLLFPCDALLLSGTVMMNEATLSGESVPQCKIPIQVTQENQSQALDMKNSHRQHILYCGTSIISVEPSLQKNEYLTCQPLPSSSHFCCLVLKTGFKTTQGKIARNVLCATERVTIKNDEALYFLLLLLLCSLTATAYVLWNSLNDALSPKGRSLYKLLLNCVMIITSVVPPEFPITMSMAVTLSLVQLGKKRIFCTEPFRLPYAGRVDICAFDKTGTLTKDEMEIRGAVGCPDSQNSDEVLEKYSNATHTAELISPQHDSALPFSARAVLVACNSLAYVDDKTTIGDSVEKAALGFSGNWIMKSLNTFIHQDKKFPNTLMIVRRFPFLSELRRMTVVVRHSGHPFKNVLCNVKETKESNAPVNSGLCQDHHIFSTTPGYYVLCKGSPETLRSFLQEIPPYFDSLLQVLNRDGFRVFALACKKLEDTNDANRETLTSIKRDELEYGLHFSGFLVLSSGIKQGTISSLTKLLKAKYKLVMITGDHPLTACQVAMEAKMLPSEYMAPDPYLLPNKIVITPNDTVEVFWTCRNQATHLTTSSINQVFELSKQYVLCLCGRDLEKLEALKSPKAMHCLLKATTIFARMSPAQKSFIISQLKHLGSTVLMCGDGTNDVGALKAAQIGISLQSGDEVTQKSQPVSRTSRLKSSQNMSFIDHIKSYENESFLEASLPGLEMASYAAPFSHRGTSIKCVPAVLRYGKATLATVMISYKIMAVNALITAFSLSVLTLDGVKLGDFQSTVESLYVSILVFITSKAKPSRHLSFGSRSVALFRPSVLSCIFGQALIHLTCLILGWRATHSYRPLDYVRDVDGEFSPNLTNTVVYLILSCTHGCTFLVNYSGLPELVPLSQHFFLRQSLLFFFLFLLVMILEIFPPLNKLFSLVPFPTLQFKFFILGLIATDIIGSYIVGRLLF